MTTNCLVTDCTATPSTKNVCPKHYQELRRKGVLTISDTEVWTRTLTPCAVTECPEGAVTYGMCSTHYCRWRRNGDPELASDPNKPQRTTEDRFWNKVERTDGCWLWTGKTDDYGKGKFLFDGKLGSAHRFSYMQHHGITLERADLLKQTCRVPQCVNPAHLRLTSELKVNSDS
jgi:hypothetical protein